MKNYKYNFCYINDYIFGRMGGKGMFENEIKNDENP